MTTFSLAIRLHNNFVIRAVHDGERAWFAMVDLFGMASGMSPPDKWPRPTRPPVALLARVCRSPADQIVRKMKEFETHENSHNTSVTAQFVAAEFTAEFLRLSGFPDEDSAMSAKDLIDTAQRVKDEKREPDAAPDEPQDEVSNLKTRLAKVGHELAYQAKRTSALERSFETQLRQLQMRLNMIEEQAAQSKHGETSRELKAHANRLYARSKQLENEGM